ncbi:MAG: hypothetical protein R2881_06195 [Eubacteriales bacterium]
MIQAAVDAATADGADYVIALTHLGIDASTSPYTSSELIENTKGIDVVIDGHSHSTIECERVKNLDGERVLLTRARVRSLKRSGYCTSRRTVASRLVLFRFRGQGHETEAYISADSGTV